MRHTVSIPVCDAGNYAGVLGRIVLGTFVDIGGEA